jgi:hypothetical protein
MLEHANSRSSKPDLRWMSCNVAINALKMSQTAPPMTRASARQRHIWLVGAEGRTHRSGRLVSLEAAAVIALLLRAVTGQRNIDG